MIKRKLGRTLLAAFLLISLWKVQSALQVYPNVEMESLLYLPSGKHLKPLTLGYNQVAADLLWIKTISYFGGHFLTDKEYPWLSHILNLIIDLDPRFDFPYYFGGIVLSLEASQVENANKILARGIEAYPDKWEYPFYIGFNHYYHQEDPLKALPYIERAAILPRSPDFIRSMVRTLHMKTGRKDASLRFFRKAYENTTDDIVREKIAEKIEQILSEKEADAASN